MGIGKRIKEAREDAGLTQEELGRIIGVTGSAITNYEKETSHPKESVMYALINALGVDANFLFQDCIKTLKAPSFSDEAKRLAIDFDKLDTYGKKQVRSVMNLEIERITDECRKKVDVSEVSFPAMVEKIVYLNPAAAGVPLYAESDYERMEFPANEVPWNADFGVRISGHSMEPTIMDGSIVWVCQTVNIREGEVGIFMVNDSAVCKRLRHNEEGIVELTSDNPTCSSVVLSEYDRIGVVGRVLDV